MATLGSTGCLLFTDPINEAPQVTIVSLTDPVYRGRPARYSAVVTDDRDSTTAITVQWQSFGPVNDGCNAITTTDWVGEKLRGAKLQSSDAPFEITPPDMSTVCLCALATDRDGARANHCERIVPANPPPVASISDPNNLSLGRTFPPCSQVHLTASASDYPKDPATDQIQFEWTGTDPTGKPIDFVSCTGSTTLAATKTDPDRCFDVPASGSYTLGLRVGDTVLKSKETTWSVPVSQVISVAEDTPPCLQRTTPDVTAGRTQLPVCRLQPCESKHFEASLVADDCQPYPGPSRGGKRPVEFIWWILDKTKPQPTWAPQVNSTNQFQLQPGNARVGDEIEVRLEVRDEKHTSNDCDMNNPKDDVCDWSGTGATQKTCIRWTTWTVQFLP